MNIGRVNSLRVNTLFPQISHSYDQHTLELIKTSNRLAFPLENTADNIHNSPVYICFSLHN